MHNAEFSLKTCLPSQVPNLRSLITMLSASEASLPSPLPPLSEAPSPRPLFSPPDDMSSSASASASAGEGRCPMGVIARIVDFLGTGGILPFLSDAKNWRRRRQGDNILVFRLLLLLLLLRLMLLLLLLLLRLMLLLLLLLLHLMLLLLLLLLHLMLLLLLLLLRLMVLLLLLLLLFLFFVVAYAVEIISNSVCL